MAEVLAESGTLVPPVNRRWQAEMWREVRKRKFTRTQKMAFYRLCVKYAVDPGTFNRVMGVLDRDPSRILGFTTDLTGAFFDRRRRAYRNTAEAREGCIMWTFAPPGTAKTGAMLWAAKEDTGAKRTEGLFGRIDAPHWVREFSPRHYIPDAIVFERENWNSGFPTGMSAMLDDPRHMYDAENLSVYQATIHRIVDRFNRERRQNRTAFGAEVNKTKAVVSDKDLNYMVWLPPLFRTDDVECHAVLLEPEAGYWVGSGFWTVPDVKRDFSPPAVSCGGQVFLEECNRKKDAAHSSLFGKRRPSWVRRDLMELLRQDPLKAVAHCFGVNMRYSYIAKFFSEKYGYPREGIQMAQEIWWNAMKARGFEINKGPKGSQLSKAKVLYDVTTGDPVAWPKMPPKPRLCDRLTTEWVREFMEDESIPLLSDIPRLEVRP